MNRPIERTLKESSFYFYLLSTDLKRIISSSEKFSLPSPKNSDVALIGTEAISISPCLTQLQVYICLCDYLINAFPSS